MFIGLLNRNRVFFFVIWFHGFFLTFLVVSRVFWQEILKPKWFHEVRNKNKLEPFVDSAGPWGRSGGPRAQPGVRPPIPPETPGFNETTTGFKFLLQKTRETANFRPSFTETVHKKKKMGGFPLKLIHNKNKK